MKNRIYILIVLLSAVIIWSDNLVAQTPGNALDFDGSNDYVSIPDAAALDITNQITVEGWFKPSASSWAYKKLITIDNTKVLATLSNFPVVVSLTDAELKDTDNGGPIQPDGDDILFLTTNGTKLSHELEEYDGSTGELTAWVKIPSLSSSEDTDFYLYYGNASCSSQQDAANVWDTNFMGVWHLEEDVVDGGTTGTHTQSASNGKDGTQHGNVETDGQVANGQDFDGSNDYVSIADHDDFTFVSGGTDQAFSVSAWIQGETNRAVILCKDEVDSEYNLYLHSDGRLGFEVYDPDWDYIGQESIASVTGSWQHVTATYDGSETSAGIKIYIDGVAQSLNLKEGGTYDGMVNTSDRVLIGAYDGGGNEYDFNGTIDEVRISTGVRDSSWIATEFNNQNSPGTFMSVSGQTAAAVSKAGAYGIGTNNTNAYASINDQTLSGAINAGEWNHISLTYNKDWGGTDEMKLYINGTLSATGDYSTAISSNNNNLILGNMAGFLGQMDEVRIWNDVRTPQEIRENMHRVVTPGAETNLAAYWQLNDSTGTSAPDSAGSNNGTLINMTNDDWVTSTAPFGGGLVGSTTSFTSGTANLATVSLTTTDAFDNAVDIIANEVLNGPNIIPAVPDSLDDRYWVVDVIGTPGTYSTNVTFTLPDSYLTLGEEADLKLYHRDSNSDGNWTLVVSGAASMTSTTVTFNGVTDLGQFTIAGSSGFPMPVELTSFTAEFDGSSVNLNWSTATEINNYGFEVHRSSHTDRWDIIGFVEGHGNTYSPKKYLFTDDLSDLANPASIESLQYRLKQIDLDGKYEYYELAEAVDLLNITSLFDDSFPVEFELHQNYPNPFNPSTTIQFGLPASGKTLLEVYNTIGQKVATLIDGEMAAGHHQVEWDASGFTSGLYVYKITTNKYAAVKKMLMIK